MTMKETTIVRVYADAAKKYTETVATIATLISMLRSLEDAGIDCHVDDYNCATYLPTIVRVTKEQLPIVRKLFGRLTVTSKSLACDYERTNELCVYVRPTNEKYNAMSFSYRTKHTGTKCKVVEQTSAAYSYKTLVCEV